MLRQIEVASIDDTGLIGELAEATWHNEEPGFQIDGVQSVTELLGVFGMLRYAAPHEEARDLQFINVFPDSPDLDKMKESRLVRAGHAHVDEGGQGLSVHQATDRVKVTLATSRGEFVSPYRHMSRRYVDNLRTGHTAPGRLTVFSHGGFEWLDETAHHYRRKSNTGNVWARYSQSETGRPELVAKVAASILERIAMDKIANSRAIYQNHFSFPLTTNQ